MLFGEEYGWRIFLQDRLAQQYSRFKAVLLVGLVWGFWHIPKILLEGPYSDYPVLGISVYMITIILISIPLGIGTFKSKSVWLAAYLHGISITPNILATYFYIPSSLLYSFGLGIYGLPVLGALTLVFLKSKEWKERS
jgi:membrane protease YdiL (CAAX protease family)